MNYSWPKNRATSRRSGQRRDVTDSGIKNVATLSINVTTFQRLIKIHVATLITHVATLQRHVKTTSRRWKSTSRRYRGT